MARLRYISILVIVLSVIFLPYWIYLTLLLAAMIFFPLFWEGILIALLVDVLYGGGVGSYARFFSPLAFLAVLILTVLVPVRERIRVHV